MRDPTKEERILSLLLAYKQKHRPVEISLLLKDGFLDILSVEQKAISDGKFTALFSEEEWLRFKESLINCSISKDYNLFRKKYFTSIYKFTFNLDHNADMCIISWKLIGGAWGETVFERPGAIILYDLGDYWVIVFFSYAQFGEISYHQKITDLQELVENLN
jgi:hypothetical protein